MQSPGMAEAKVEKRTCIQKTCVQSRAAHAILAILLMVLINMLVRGSGKSISVFSPSHSKLPLCENSGSIKTESLTLWTMMSGDETNSEIEAMISMLQRANEKLGKPFSPWVLQEPKHQMSLSARQTLLTAGWNICTLTSSFDSKQLALRALWGMYGIERIIYLDVRSFISGDISSLATVPIEPDSKLAATPLYDGRGWWTDQFSTSTMVIKPSRKTFKKMDRKASTFSGSSFDEFMNELFPNFKDWTNLSFRFGTSTEVIVEDPEYVTYKMKRINVFFFKTAPWIACTESNTLMSVCDSWKNGTDTSGQESKFSHLFQGKIENPVLNFTLQHPGTLAPFYDNLAEVRSKVRGSQHKETKFIWTTDRRKERIPRHIPHKREDLFPNDADLSKHWTILFGVPSVDSKKGAYFRDLQRNSFFKYDKVWNIHKSPDATVLAKYLLAHHPSTNYTYSPEILKEAVLSQDILFFDMKEGNWSGVGPKGIDCHIGMSRKAYAFYTYAADFVKADYICKGDDDAFYRLNMMAVELESFAYPAIYHGRFLPWYGISRTSGLLVTMSFDLVDWMRDSVLAEDFDFKFEDVMVGRWFYLANIRTNVVRDCRGHCIHRIDAVNEWTILQNITDSSMILHGILPYPEVFEEMMQRFPDTHLLPLSMKTHIPKAQDGNGNSLQFQGQCPKPPRPITYYNWGGWCTAKGCSLPPKPDNPMLRR